MNRDLFLCKLLNKIKEAGPIFFNGCFYEHKETIFKKSVFFLDPNILCVWMSPVLDKEIKRLHLPVPCYFKLEIDKDILNLNEQDLENATIFIENFYCRIKKDWEKLLDAY